MIKKRQKFADLKNVTFVTLGHKNLLYNIVYDGKRHRIGIDFHDAPLDNPDNIKVISNFNSRAENNHVILFLTSRLAVIQLIKICKSILPESEFLKKKRYVKP